MAWPSPKLSDFPQAGDGHSKEQRALGDGEGDAYCTNKAGVMPAEAQRFQEAVSSINLEVTASTFCAEHLLIVW